MSKPLHIVLLGTGNVAHHLAASFTDNPEGKLVQVFNHRLSKQAKAFSETFKVPLVNTYHKLDTTADVYILSVKDSALSEVATELAELKLQGLVAHTSGSMEMSVLQKTSKLTGVYYPLQTFTKQVPVDWKSTPLLIEASNASAMKVLSRIATSVSEKVKAVDSETRLKLHLSAVFACNFTNALYVTGFEYISKNLGMKEAELLWPIMLSSFHKVIYNKQPKQAQTGPAMRNDQVVMDKHLKLLGSDKQLTEVYKLLSQLIITQQASNKSSGEL